jgi:hypothetical protein
MDIQELKKNGLPLLRGLLAPPAFPGPKATLVRLALMVLRVKKAILAKQVPPVQMALKDPPALMVLPDRKATQVIQARLARLAKQVPPVRMVFKAKRVTLVTPAPLAQIPQYLGRKVQKVTPAPPALMVCKALWAPLGQMAQLVHKASKVRLVHKAQQALTALLLRQQFQPMPEIRPR